VVEVEELTLSGVSEQLQKCDLCGSRNAGRLYDCIDNIYRCLNCGLCYQFPQPKTVSLKKLYNESYFVSDASARKGYDNYFRDEKNIKSTYRKRFKHIARVQPKAGRVLDVGCAAGFFMSVAKERGWDVEGIELSKHATQVANAAGHRVHCGTLETFENSAELFDAITMWDVIEHVQSPLRSLRVINSLLRVGGHVILTTPAIDSLQARIFRHRWMGIKEDEHLYFFSHQTLSRLLRACGFSVTMAKFEGKFVSFDFFKRRIGCYSRRGSELLRKLFPPNSKNNFNFYVNPLDIHFFIAKKVRSIE
jgi:2-polyprenyl-3-methyl-5-hydroxy-6-metoxy-1,4-benzoquinol methylase